MLNFGPMPLSVYPLLNSEGMMTSVIWYAWCLPLVCLTQSTHGSVTFCYIPRGLAGALYNADRCLRSKLSLPLLEWFALLGPHIFSHSRNRLGPRILYFVKYFTIRIVVDFAFVLLIILFSY